MPLGLLLKAVQSITHSSVKREAGAFVNPDAPAGMPRALEDGGSENGLKRALV